MKNPLTRIIADKTVSAINHSIEKKKVIRAKEIEAEANVSIEQIRSSKSSIKDEVLTIKITLIFLAIFWPTTQPWMEKGFEILKKLHKNFGGLYLLSTLEVSVYLQLIRLEVKNNGS